MALPRFIRAITASLLAPLLASPANKTQLSLLSVNNEFLLSCYLVFETTFIVVDNACLFSSKYLVLKAGHCCELKVFFTIYSLFEF